MKLFKKIAGFILAFAMILAIAMPSVVMADETYTLTLDNTVKGHTYEVYQILLVNFQQRTTREYYLI